MCQSILTSNVKVTAEITRKIEAWIQLNFWTSLPSRWASLASQNARTHSTRHCDSSSERRKLCIHRYITALLRITSVIVVTQYKSKTCSLRKRYYSRVKLYCYVSWILYWLYTKRYWKSNHYASVSLYMFNA